MSANKKTRTATKKQPKFQFQWWMAVGMVVLVALAGVLILRFSHASGSWKDTYPFGQHCEWLAGVPTCTMGDSPLSFTTTTKFGSFTYTCDKNRADHNNESTGEIFYTCPLVQ